MRKNSIYFLELLKKQNNDMYFLKLLKKHNNDMYAAYADLYNEFMLLDNDLKNNIYKESPLLRELLEKWHFLSDSIVFAQMYIVEEEMNKAGYFFEEGDYYKLDNE